MLRKSIAAFFVFIFALFTIPTFLIRGITGTYVNPQFYQTKVVDRSYELLVNYISRQSVANSDIALYLNSDEIREILMKSFTVDQVREVTINVVDQLNALTDRRRDNKIVINLEPLKENIPIFADELSKVIATNIPDCPSIEDLDIEDIDKLSTGVPECVTPFTLREDLAPRIKRELDKYLNNEIPGEFTIDFAAAGDENVVQIWQIILTLDYIQFMLPLSLLIILLFIALLVYKPITSVMKYLGSALMLGGISAAIVAQLISQFPNMLINSENFPELLSSELADMFELYNFILGFLVAKMTQFSIYFVGVGVLVILTSLYLSHHRSGHGNF